MTADVAPLQFCPQLVSILQSREVRGRSGASRPITSVSTLNNLVTMRNLFADLKPKRSLEVGLAFGGSALLLASSHRELGRDPAGQHTAIDPFQASQWDDAGLMALEEAGLRGYLDFRQDLSSAVLPQLAAEESSFDFIYVDGSHLFEDVFVDFYFATRVLADGGLLAFDDSSYPHVKKVLQFIRNNFRFAYEPVDLAPYRADHGKSLRYKVATMLGKTQLSAFRKVGPSTRNWDSPFLDF